MHGDKELKCLDIIKKAVFYKNDQLMTNPLTGKTYLDVSDAEYKNSRNWFINPECYQSYFGLSEYDREEFDVILRTARTNSNPSQFPDFKFENGFIEHFQVTSSSVNRKGAEQTRKETEFRRTVDEKTQEIESEWGETPSFDEVRSQSWMFSNPVHSYELLDKSFRRNWEHHMESLKKYNDSKQIGIFMIEYPDCALSMCEDVYHEWIEGMSHGDMREQEKFREYRLSRDRKLLKYIFKFKDDIKYVIFINQTRFEVICTENIPYLIKVLPWDYAIYPLQVMISASVYNISVPVDSKKGDEIDDKS